MLTLPGETKRGNKARDNLLFVSRTVTRSERLTGTQDKLARARKREIQAPRPGPFFLRIKS